MARFLSSRAWRRRGAALALIILAAGLGLTLRGGRAQAQNAGNGVELSARTALAPTGLPRVSVGAPLRVQSVRAGFLGVSTEYYGIEWYAGTDAGAPDPVFEQLLANLAPGGRIVLRVGGDSADWLWLSTTGVTRSPALKVAVNARTIAVLAALVKYLNARVILDLNLEDANLRLADHIAQAFTAALGARHILAYELGNEPDLWDVLGFYTNRSGRPVLGRPEGYTLSDYATEFNRLGATLPSQIPLAGPSLSRKFTGTLAPFLTRARHLGLVTVHAYAGQSCGTHPGEADYPTVPALVSARETVGLISRLEPELAQAHAAGRAIRIDEMNNIACFGARGVSNTYATALWALETSLAAARAGFDGLNIHTVPSAQYRLFVLRRAGGTWTGQVLPEYFGLLAFAQAVPTGSRFLAAETTPGGPPSFALRTPGGQDRVIVVNAGRARRLAVRVPGGGAEAVVTFLRGPSLTATRGVTLGGQAFASPTTTGQLIGQPQGTAVTRVDGDYVVSLPAHSAAILSVG